MLNKSSEYMWWRKYCPSTVNDYVCKDAILKANLTKWVEIGEVPHLGLFGPAGTGKSSLINVIISEFIARGYIDESDVMRLNMSDEGIDAVRDKIIPCAMMMPTGNFRIIVLEEMEKMHTKAQGSLKLVLENSSLSTRFFLTSNNPNMIDPAILSRLDQYKINAHDMSDFVVGLSNILTAEGVTMDINAVDIVMKYAKIVWPDFRSALTVLQKSVQNGVLLDIDASPVATQDYAFMLVNSLKSGSIREMREIIVKNVPDDEIEKFYSVLYENLDLFSTDADKKMLMTLKIRDGLVNSTRCAIKEICLTATLIELELIASS